MSKEQADYYMVQINLGSAAHSIVPLYEDGGVFISDPAFDSYENAKDVMSGYVERGGRICYYTTSLEDAESVQTGIYMARKMLRHWVDG